MKPSFLYLITITVIVLDQLTKIIIRNTFYLGQSVEVLGNFFRFTYVENPGAAFSLSLGNDNLNFWFFSLAAIVAILFILYMIKITRANIPLLSLHLILGGAVGNLIDRILFRSVTDFLDFDFFNIIIERWPVFNIADSAIVVGASALLIYTVFFETREKVKTYD